MKITIEVGVYDAKVVLVTSNEELMRESKHATKDMDFITLEQGRKFAVLVTDMWGDFYDHRFIQCLSHEFNHVAMCILGQSGIKFDYENQEALCYLQDYLIAQAYKAINKQTKRVEE